MHFRYREETCAIALLNKEPYQVIIDGKEVEAKTAYYQGDWSLILPSGEHEVEILANSPAIFILDLASFFSSSFIVFFGFIMSTFLVLLYVAVLLRRWVTNCYRWMFKSRLAVSKNSE